MYLLLGFFALLLFQVYQWNSSPLLLGLLVLTLVVGVLYGIWYERWGRRKERQRPPRAASSSRRAPQREVRPEDEQKKQVLRKAIVGLFAAFLPLFLLLLQDGNGSVIWYVLLAIAIGGGFGTLLALIGYQLYRFCKGAKPAQRHWEPPSQPDPPSPPPLTAEQLKRLDSLAALRKAGILEEPEYQARRQQILEDR